MVDVDAPLRTLYCAKFLRWKCGMGKGTSVTVKSQVNLIRRVAYLEIFVGIIILFSQTVAIASSHEFATRSLTGIWTSWFFFISAGITLFWSSRCTFNGLLSVLVLQIISATMGIPLFTASCVLFGVYPFRWNLLPDGTGTALIGSSLSILVTNLIMMFASLLQMILNGYNTYNCYFLAYGGKPNESTELDEEVGVGNGRTSIARDSKEGSRNVTPSHVNSSKKIASTHTYKSGNRASNGNSRSGSNSGNNRSGGGASSAKPTSVTITATPQRPTTSSSSKAKNTTFQNNEDDWDDNTTTTQQQNNQQQNEDDDWGDGSATQNQQNGNEWGNTANNDENWDEQNNGWDDNNGGGDWVDNNSRPSNKGKRSGSKKDQKTGQRTLSPTNGGKTKIVYADPSMPQPPPDLTLASTDIVIIKYCGVTGVLLAILIFSCQTAMLAMATEPGLKIAIGIWGALYYAATGVITVYNGWKPTAQSSVAIFILQALQLILSLPLVGIAYYIVAVFGSCIQYAPVSACPAGGGGLAITVLASVMAISGTIQGLISLILVLICSQAVCGIRCMVSGATVYPTL